MAAVSQLEHWDWIRWTSIVAWEATTLREEVSLQQKYGYVSTASVRPHLGETENASHDWRCNTSEVKEVLLLFQRKANKAAESMLLEVNQKRQPAEVTLMKQPKCTLR